MAVTGTSGGLGASVVVAALAVRAVAAGRSACAVDLDPLGGGLDVVLGLEQTAGTRWGDLASLEGEADARAVVPTLPRADGVRVLSHGRHGGPVPPDVVRALLCALVTACDVVVLDLPRWAGIPDGAPLPDHHLLLSGTGPGDVAALSAVLAAPAPALVGSTPREVLLRAPSSSGGAVRHLAVVLREQLGTPVVGVVPDDRSVPAALARGVTPGLGAGPLVTAVDAVLADLVHGRGTGAA